ncbi:unnamed protein product, partial [marine sediment metagenome]
RITLPDESQANVLERTGQKPRVFAVEPDTGEEILRYYPKVNEAEHILSESASDIYTYDQDYRLTQKIAQVQRVARITLPDESQANVLERTGQKPRVFAVEPDTGEEILRYYPKVNEAEHILSESASDIYTYDQDYRLTQKIAQVQRVARITLPDESQANVLERTGQKPRVFAVEPDTGEEILRYYPKVNEAEHILSESASDIYTYDQDYRLTQKIAQVQRVARITLPDESQANVLERTGQKPRVFAVEPDTGEEILRYYPKVNEAEHILSESASDIYTYDQDYRLTQK